MLNIIFTLDYEIHGNGDGSPRDLMVAPTARMLDLFDEYGAKLTIMADVAEILKFREYKEQFGRDDYHYEAIVAQLKNAIERGHDVQLHLHCSYFNARFENGSWVQDWSEYNFAGLSEQRLNEVLRIGKDFLENQLRPVNPAYKCYVFRAANWAVSPSRNIVRALVSNGFEIDTSVFKYGRREGIVSFDYSDIPSELVPWRTDEGDICRREDNGPLLEAPIYSERRWLGAFLSPNRIYRAFSGRAHALRDDVRNGNSFTDSIQKHDRLGKFFFGLVGRYAWKADFNQCTGRQLIRAIKRAAEKYDRDGDALPFVLIGHSKLFTRQNERSLKSFLSFVAQAPNRFRFGKFSPWKMSFRRNPLSQTVGGYA
jgi:hypothetical protein